GGKMASITYGKYNPVKLTNEDLINNRDKFFGINSDPNSFQEFDNYSYVSFEAKVFDSVNFFASLDITAFVISNNPKLASLIQETVIEDLSDIPGKDRVIKINAERIAVEI